MSFTVEQISNQFSGLTRSDLQKLTGKSDFDDKTTISNDRIVAFSKDMSIWAAKQEGTSFLNSVKGPQRLSIAQAAGIDDELQKNNRLDGSIFDQKR